VTAGADVAWTEADAAAVAAVAALRGSYAQAPLPSAPDAIVESLVRRFEPDDPIRCVAIGNSLTRASEQVLTAYAIRMASLAVRERSVERLRLGLLGFALASRVPDLDWRDFLFMTSPLHDAALRLGPPARAPVLQAADLADHRVAPVLRGIVPPPWRWLCRLRRSLPVLGSRWRIHQDADGFRYRPTVTYTEADILQAILEGQLTALRRALETYREDAGRYPTTEQGLAALWIMPDREPKPGAWRGAYIHPPMERDPWGHPWSYRCDESSSHYELSEGEHG
jgi:type II secretion system protein G